jgi:hypothetical protein
VGDVSEAYKASLRGGVESVEVRSQDL